MVIVVNDNGRSYSPTIGGVADALATLRLRPGYEQALDAVRQALHRAPVVGSALYDALHAIKKGLKDVLSPQGMFEDLGLKYVGPVDGHDIGALESRAAPGALVRRAGDRARRHHKGYGYPPAETDEIDAWHAHRRLRPRQRRQSPLAAPTWTGCLLRRARPRSAPSEPTSSPSPRRCCTRPGSRRSPSGSRSGPSTSASPSSTR